MVLIFFGLFWIKKIHIDGTYILHIGFHELSSNFLLYLGEGLIIFKL